MTSALKEKIIERMALKNLSIAELERRAGLTIHSVRNILKDRIKKPNIHSLQAIAAAMDCSLMDLVDSPTRMQEGATRDINFPHKKTRISPPVKHPDLILACTKSILDLIAEHDLKTSVDDFMDIVRKVYVYSSKGSSQTVDMRFAEWLIETQLGYSRAI